MTDSVSQSRQVRISDRIKTWLPQVVLAIAVLFVLYNQWDGVKMFYHHARSVVNFPYPIDYGEGPLLDQVARLAMFENLYQPDISQPPYTITNYPPLYPLVQVPFYWIFGPELWYGRVISLLGVLAAAVFIGLTVYTLTNSIAGGILSAVLLPFFPFVLHWAPLTRVDSLALGLSWAGIFILVRWGDQRKGLIWAAIFLVAAVYTRQSYGLAAPLAGFIYLLRQSPRKRAFQLAFYTGAIGLAIFIFMNILS
ncbi:MAG: glycosyltransferase family 39 protein, partial [Anaerolineaceae bacterium]